MRIVDILYIELMLGFVGLFLSLSLDAMLTKIDFIILFGIQMCFTAVLMIKSKAWDKSKIPAEVKRVRR